MNLFEITSKKILVTGASQGIGYTLAKGYAQAGAQVTLNGRNPEKLNKAVAQLKAEGLQTSASVFDVTNAESVKKGISQILEEAGGIDVLVNNAGIIKREKLEDLELEDWDAVIKTDLTAPFLVSKYVARGMIRSGGGKII